MRISLIFILTLFKLTAIAQVASSIEHVDLMIDRSVYFATEPILFFAEIDGEKSTNCPDLSTVLYTEILDRNGVSIFKKKTLIVDCKSTGILEIPEETITGVYLLRSYTKFQQNLPVNDLETKVIRIINPRQKAQQKAEIPVLTKTEKRAEIQILIDEEKRSLKAIAQDSTHKISAISIVEKGLVIEDWMSPKFTNDKSILNKAIKPVLPETRGIDIRGKLLLKAESNKSFPKLIYAATLGVNRQFHVVEADSQGRFMISFSQISGFQKIYITSNLDAEILVETDFSNDMPSYSWTYDTLYKKHLTSFESGYSNYQIPALFQCKIQSTETEPIALTAPFTNPTEEIFLADFVPLKNMEEVFSEIVPFVAVRKANGKRQITMYDFKTKLSVEEPLVMVDNIPFQNHEQVLAIPYSKVHSIDVFAEPLLISDQLFKGIINIKTEDGLLGGLALPSNCVALDYQTTNALATFTFTDLDKKIAFGNTIQFERIPLPNQEVEIEIPQAIQMLDHDVIVYYRNAFGQLESSIQSITHK
ncbi:MAG: hypothetical protein NWS53_10965 [Salibacteraceae bacterium]|nr:hypothetical protein [Salibacteraceae bacterium]